MTKRTACGARQVAAGVLLAAVLIGGCATGPDPTRIGPDGAESLRRAAEHIEQAPADLDRFVEHWRRALTLTGEAWPELQQDLRALDTDNAASADRQGDAVLRAVAGRLRTIADGMQAGSLKPPQREPLLTIAGVLRDHAAELRRRADDTGLERIRERIGERENISEAEQAPFDELAQAVDALREAADHYDTAADEIDRAAAVADAYACADGLGLVVAGAART